MRTAHGLTAWRVLTRALCVYRLTACKVLSRRRDETRVVADVARRSRRRCGPGPAGADVGESRCTCRPVPARTWPSCEPSMAGGVANSTSAFGSAPTSGAEASSRWLGAYGALKERRLALSPCMPVSCIAAFLWCGCLLPVYSNWIRIVVKTLGMEPKMNGTVPEVGLDVSGADSAAFSATILRTSVSVISCKRSEDGSRVR